MGPTSSTDASTRFDEFDRSEPEVPETPQGQVQVPESTGDDEPDGEQSREPEPEGPGEGGRDAAEPAADRAGTLIATTAARGPSGGGTAGGGTAGGGPSGGGGATEGTGLRRATTVMAVGTTLSRATGVLRIFALTYALGTLNLADSYNLANTMPNIVHDIVLGGILSATFVPVFVQRLTTRADDEAWDAVSAVVSVTMIVIAAASLLFLVAVPFIIDATTSLNHGVQAAQSRAVAKDLLFLFVPQLACYGFISVGTALLNARRKFGAPMFTPIANNVVLIAVLLVFGTTVRHASLAGVAAHRGQLLLLGLGTTAGVVVQAGLMIPSLRRAGSGPALEAGLPPRGGAHHPAAVGVDLRAGGGQPARAAGGPGPVREGGARAR